MIDMQGKRIHLLVLREKLTENSHITQGVFR